MSLLLQESEESLLNFLNRTLSLKYEKAPIRTSSYIFVQGDIPVMLVAHLDTVFNHEPLELFYDTSRNVLYSPFGAGFDDRAGVFAIMKILLKSYRPSILFTRGEEMGGIGARNFANDVLKMREKPRANILIELDRRGKDDAVFYQCANQDFKNFITSFGFIEKQGSYSDISFLMPALNLCGVNLSVGYENEHTSAEILRVSHLNETINKVKTILSAEIPAFEYSECAPMYDERDYYEFQY